MVESSATGAKLLLINPNGNVFASAVESTLGGVGTVEINSTNTITLTHSLTDDLELIQSGSGTTILISSFNSYTGATSITGGTLQIGTTPFPGSIGPKSAVDIEESATFVLVNVKGNILANNISAGTSGVGALIIESDKKITLSGALTDGSGGVLTVKQSGSGTTILTSAKNTYSGETTVSDGTLQIGSLSAAGSDWQE